MYQKSWAWSFENKMLPQSTWVCHWLITAHSLSILLGKPNTRHVCLCAWFKILCDFSDNCWFHFIYPDFICQLRYQTQKILLNHSPLFVRMWMYECMIDCFVVLAHAPTAQVQLSPSLFSSMILANLYSCSQLCAWIRFCIMCKMLWIPWAALKLNKCYCNSIGCDVHKCYFIVKNSTTTRGQKNDLSFTVGSTMIPDPWSLKLLLEIQHHAKFNTKPKSSIWSRCSRSNGKIH